jgi:hypothetical protein
MQLLLLLSLTVSFLRPRSNTFDTNRSPVLRYMLSQKLLNVQGQKVASFRDEWHLPEATASWYHVGSVSALYAQGCILCTGDGVLSAAAHSRPHFAPFGAVLLLTPRVTGGCD